MGRSRLVGLLLSRFGGISDLLSLARQGLLEALSGDHLNIFVLHVLGLLDGRLRHVVLLLVVHRWVAVSKVLNRRGSYIIILNNFLNVHGRLRTLDMVLLLWEHEVVLGSELGCYLRLRSKFLLSHDLFLLLDDFSLDVFQTIFN